MLRAHVRCEIETFDIHKAPNFEAISYCWGKGSDLTYINVGERHRFPITRSLYAALTYLRYRKEERLIWVDAICINQENIAEKNEIVAKMHIVFQTAHQVVVWLGQPVRPWSFRVILEIPHEEDIIDTKKPAYFRPRCQIENRANKNARTLVKFGQLPWFSRGWVVQEICFARKIQVQFGRHVLSWEQFQEVGSKLATVLPWFLQGMFIEERKDYFDLQDCISALADMRLRLQQGQRMTLSSLLPFARSKCTTDPRDKIFAFTNLLAAVPASLQPDYGEETKITFMKSARLLMTGDVGLRLLAECESNPESESDALSTLLPSWVPGWSHSRQCESLLGGLSTSSKGHEYSAGTHLLPSTDFQIQNDVLVLEAFIWDDIVLTDPLATVLWYTPSVWHRVLQNLDLDPRMGDLPPLTLSNIVCNSWNDLKDICFRLELCNRDLDGFKILDMKDILAQSERADQCRRIVGRNLMFSSENYVGWVPPAAAVGDVISIIPGCHVPMVLRRINDPSHIVNESSLPLEAGEVQEKRPGERLPSYCVIGEACRQYSSPVCDFSVLIFMPRCTRPYGRRSYSQPEQG